MKTSTLPVIAIVGRPNVGKSTFVNACTRRRISVVDPTEGVTRDRVALPMVHDGRAFELTDTGGIGIVDVQDLSPLVEQQIDRALAAAAAIIFMVDATAGLTAPDKRIAKRLHQLGKPVVLAANKSESNAAKSTAAEFVRLGFGEPMLLSAKNRENVNGVISAAVSHLPEDGPTEIERAELRIAIVGRRNAGKSTLVNALAGDERVIVSEKPGTTRDAVDVTIRADNGAAWTLIDTAGVTSHAHDGKDPIQWYSEHRAMSAIRRCDVAILLVDALRKVSGLEKRLAREIETQGKPCVLAANKWDLIDDVTTDKFKKYFSQVLPGLDRAPLVFLSAKERMNVRRLIEVCGDLHEQAGGKVSTGELNRFVRVAFAQRAPRIRSSQVARMFYCTQVGTHPPTFRIFVNDPNLFTPEFRRYLDHRFRDTFPFPEVPVRFDYVARARKGLNAVKAGPRNKPSRDAEGEEE